MAESAKVCELCSVEFGGLDPMIRVKKRGLNTCIERSKERGDDKWKKWLGRDDIIVHKSCNVSYINLSNVSAAKKRKLVEIPKSSSNETSSATGGFNFSGLCIICGELCDLKMELKKAKPRRRTIYHIKSNTTWRQRVLAACEKVDDQLSNDVKKRCDFVDDLSTVGAKYHNNCLQKFLNEREFVKKVGSNPGNTKFQEQFEKVFAFIDNSEDCQWSLEHFISMMGDPSPSKKYIKQVLQERYGEKIIFSSHGQYKTTVTFKGHADDCLMNFFKDNLPIEDNTERKNKVLQLAAQYIREDIRAIEVNLESYPSTTEFFSSKNIDQYIPKTLNDFLSEIILPDKKDIANAIRKTQSIAHAIVSATRPASAMSTLQLALSLYVHTQYRAKDLINILYRLGFCASYDETLLFEKSAVMEEQTQLQATEDSFIQFVSHNADYDVQTSEGKNSFHCIGGIECITPRSSAAFGTSINRLKHSVSASTIAAKKRIKMYEYEQPQSRSLSRTEIQDIRKLRPRHSDDTYLLPGEILWISGHWLKVSCHVGYNGFMELRTNSSLYDVTKIKYLPFICLKATDNTALLSTIIYAIKEAKKINQKNIFLTFDQQLYVKAREIVADIQMGLTKCQYDMHNVFIRLGGFHLLMSFLGCIGKVMDGSGLQEAWKKVYDDKLTEKMVTGKYYSRSLRANFYTEAALLINILDECNINQSERREILNAISMEPAEGEVKSNEHQQTILEQLEKLEIVTSLTNKVKQQMSLIVERGKTAALWIQYIKMISLVRSFIQAERTGDFSLHLSVIIEMLPFFHSCGNFHFATSAHLYVQDMLQLKERMQSPEEFEKFIKKGYNTIRKKEKFFAGTSTDMIIEQSLIRSIHSVTGLFRGHSVEECVASSWLNTVNCVSYVNEDLQDFCGMTSTSSEQHRDSKESSMEQDKALLNTFIKWFQDHPPFIVRDSIMSIATGVTGEPGVNCYEAESLGVRSFEKIIPLQYLEDDGTFSTTKQSFGNVNLTQELQVIPLSISNGAIMIGETMCPIDNKILFDRFRQSEPDESYLPTYLQYELSPYPVSLFETITKIRHNDDSDESIFSLFDSCKNPPDTNNKFFIMDAETLLSLVTWPKSCTYGELYNSYIDFIVKNYKAQCVVIFKSESNIADHPKFAEKYMAVGVQVCNEIYFDATKTITKTQDHLFSNGKNKARFLTQLSEILRKSGIKVQIVSGREVDRVIVDEAIDRWQTTRNTVILSNNVDILCILIAIAHADKNIYFHIPQSSWYSSTVLLRQYKGLAPYIPVIHALSGCKTTSSLFEIAKKDVFNTFKKEKSNIINFLKDFRMPLPDLPSFEYSLSNLVNSGEKLIVKMYKGSTETLNELRYIKYVQAMTDKSKADFNLATLPPTLSAATFHIFRVYWQVQTWFNNRLTPTNWGWTLTNGTMLVPFTTTLPPMPEDLIGLISCKCQTDCKPRTCSCMMSGLLCSPLCTECPELTCKNKISDLLLADEDGMMGANVNPDCTDKDELLLEVSKNIPQFDQPGPSSK